MPDTENHPGRNTPGVGSCKSEAGIGMLRLASPKGQIPHSRMAREINKMSRPSRRLPLREIMLQL
jgi:hypothetical protein